MRHALKWRPVPGEPGNSVADGWEPNESYLLHCHERGRWSSFFIDHTRRVVTLALNQPFWTARRWANDHYNEPSRGKANVH